MADFNTGVVRDQPGGFTEGSQQGLWLDKPGAVVAMDWITKLILGGHGYNVTAGTITAPLVGDVAITDAAAEMAISPASGMTAIPFYQKITRLKDATQNENLAPPPIYQAAKARALDLAAKGATVEDL